MSWEKLSLVNLIIILSINFSSAQIISVAPGTNFNIVSGTIIAVDGLDITPSSDFILNTGISRSSIVSNSTSFPYIPRVYVFSQPTNSFSGTFKINYSDADLNGINIAESNLKVIYHNNSWSFDAASSNDTNANYTISSTYNAITLDELSLATCLPTSSSIAMKLSNQTTLAKYLSNSVSSWSVLSGVDAADFSINPNGSSDELLFNTVADNTNPQDANLDNNYLVTVSNGCEVQNLSITISPFCGNWADIVQP